MDFEDLFAADYQLEDMDMDLDFEFDEQQVENEEAHGQVFENPSGQLEQQLEPAQTFAGFQDETYGEEQEENKQDSSESTTIYIDDQPFFFDEAIRNDAQYEDEDVSFATTRQQQGDTIGIAQTSSVDDELSYVWPHQQQTLIDSDQPRFQQQTLVNNNFHVAEDMALGDFTAPEMEFNIDEIDPSLQNLPGSSTTPAVDPQTLSSFASSTMAVTPNISTTDGFAALTSSPFPTLYGTSPSHTPFPKPFWSQMPIHVPLTIPTLPQTSTHASFLMPDLSQMPFHTPSVPSASFQTRAGASSSAFNPMPTLTAPYDSQSPGFMAPVSFINQQYPPTATGSNLAAPLTFPPIQSPWAVASQRDQVPAQFSQSAWPMTQGATAPLTTQPFAMYNATSMPSLTPFAASGILSQQSQQQAQAGVSSQTAGPRVRFIQAQLDANNEFYITAVDGTAHPAVLFSDVYAQNEIDNVTSYPPEHASWGSDRNARPDILFVLNPDQAFKHKLKEAITEQNQKRSSIVFNAWTDANGRVLLNKSLMPLRCFPHLPHTFSTEVPGWYLEALFRIDPRPKHDDLIDRMPSSSTMNTRALHQRRARARQRYRIKNWHNSVKDNDLWEVIIDESLDAWAYANNSTRNLTDLTPEQIALYEKLAQNPKPDPKKDKAKVIAGMKDTKTRANKAGYSDDHQFLIDLQDRIAA